MNGRNSSVFHCILAWMGSGRLSCSPPPFCCLPASSCRGISRTATKEFYIWLLILAAATIGVFMSLDLFFLYFFYEMSVIPMYLLLGMWGSHTKKYLEMTDPEGLKLRDSVGFILNFGSNSKEYAAMKLVLFLSAFAVVALMGILLIYKYSGLNTFDILVLREQANFMNIPALGTTLDKIIWVLVFFGFASIAPLWPLHSWSPVGHAAAPAATSMLHAGVLMKLGHFSIIRVAFEILPETTRELMPIAAVLCMFSIMYGGFVAFYAKDTKYVIGYSSSSHMGYVFLGMAALNYISLSGAVIYMFAHAMATGMLFAMAGWVYDQTHTRDIPSLGGLVQQDAVHLGLFCRGLYGFDRDARHGKFYCGNHDHCRKLEQVPAPSHCRHVRDRADLGLPVQNDAGSFLRPDEPKVQSCARCDFYGRSPPFVDHDRGQYWIRNFPDAFV